MSDIRHEASHRDLLRAVLACEAPDAAFESSELARCACCRAEYREMLETARTLDAAGDDLATQVDAAMRGPVPDAEAAVRRAIGAELGRPRFALWQAAVAAVLLLGLGLGLWSILGTSQPTGGGVRMGTEGRLAVPQGEVGEFSVFEMPVDCPEGGYLRLAIRDEARPERAPLVFLLRTAQWTPTAELPNTLSWSVSVYDGSSASPAEIHGPYYASRVP